MPVPQTENESDIVQAGSSSVTSTDGVVSKKIVKHLDVTDSPSVVEVSTPQFDDELVKEFSAHDEIEILELNSKRNHKVRAPTSILKLKVGETDESFWKSPKQAKSVTYSKSVDYAGSSEIDMRSCELSTPGIISAFVGLGMVFGWLWIVMNVGPGLGDILSGLIFIAIFFIGGVICVFCGYKVRRAVLPALVMFVLGLSIPMFARFVLGIFISDGGDPSYRQAECAGCLYDNTPSFDYRYGYYLCAGIMKGLNTLEGCDGYEVGSMDKFSSDKWSADYDRLWYCTGGSQDQVIIDACIEDICLGTPEPPTSSTDYPYKWAHYYECARKVANVYVGPQTKLLYVHATLGLICLVTGFIQFIGRVNVCCMRRIIPRKSQPHRVIGIVYTVCSLTTAVLGVCVGHYIGLNTNQMILISTYLAFNVLSFAGGFICLFLGIKQWHGRFMKTNFLVMWGSVILRIMYLVCSGFRYYNWADEDPNCSLEDETFNPMLSTVYLLPILTVILLVAIYIIYECKTGERMSFRTRYVSKFFKISYLKEKMGISAGKFFSKGGNIHLSRVDLANSPNAAKKAGSSAVSDTYGDLDSPPGAEPLVSNSTTVAMGATSGIHFAGQNQLALPYGARRSSAQQQPIAADHGSSVQL